MLVVWVVIPSSSSGARYLHRGHLVAEPARARPAGRTHPSTSHSPQSHHLGGHGLGGHPVGACQAEISCNRESQSGGSPALGMTGAGGRCQDSPIFTQPLSVISRLETFRSLWEMEQLEVRDRKEKPVPSFHAWPPYTAGAPTLMGTKPPPGAAPDDATCSQDVGGVPRHPFVPPAPSCRSHLWMM